MFQYLRVRLPEQGFVEFLPEAFPRFFYILFNLFVIFGDLVFDEYVRAVSFL